MAFQVRIFKHSQARHSSKCCMNVNKLVHEVLHFYTLHEQSLSLENLHMKVVLISLSLSHFVSKLLVCLENCTFGRHIQASVIWLMLRDYSSKPTQNFCNIMCHVPLLATAKHLQTMMLILLYFKVGIILSDLQRFPCSLIVTIVIVTTEQVFFY